MPRISILGNEQPDASVFPDLVSNQLTVAAAPSVGGQRVWVMPSSASNLGVQGRFAVPATPTTASVIVSGILDGAPGATDTLAFGFRKRAVADNEPADGTFDAEQFVQVTIGNNYLDEDRFAFSIALTAADYAENDEVYFWLYRRTTGTSYTGNVLLTDVLFAWT